MSDSEFWRGHERQLYAALAIDYPARGFRRCPFPDHEDKRPSFRVDVQSWRWFCSCGRRVDGSDKAGGDVIDAIRRMSGLDYGAALDWARGVLGIQKPGITETKPREVSRGNGTHTPPFSGLDRGVPFPGTLPDSEPSPEFPYKPARKVPTFADLPRPGCKCQPVRIDPYHTADRKVAEVRARYECEHIKAAGRTKEVIPWSHTGKDWIAKQMPGKRPLYRLTDILGRPDDPILFVEGEGKKWERASDLFPDFVATSCSGGALSTAGMDFSPLKGRKVVIWRDNDKPGQTYADGVARGATEAEAAEVRLVQIPDGWPDKWDLGDEPPSDTIDLREVLDEAAPYTPFFTNGEKGPLPTSKMNGKLNGHLNGATVPASQQKFKITALEDIGPVLSGMWLVKGLLPARGLCTVFGEPGCGKSFLTLDMALHIAAGKEYAGRKTTQGRVIYIAAEGQGGFRNRVYAAVRELELDKKCTQFGLIEVAPNLGRKDGDADELIKAIEVQTGADDLPVCVIVVDTTSQTMGGENENLEGMATFIVNVNHIGAHFQCLVIAVHHVGKSDTQTPRGWSGLHGANDTEFKVSGLSNPHTAEVVKQKDGDPGLSFQFDLKPVDVGEDEDGEPVKSCVLEMTTELGIHAKEKNQKDASKQPRRSIREFDAAFNEAMLAHASEYRIEGDGPLVQAVWVHEIKPYFAKRWATDEKDKRARAKKASNAFQATLRSLPPKYHSREEMDGERIWRA